MKRHRTRLTVARETIRVLGSARLTEPHGGEPLPSRETDATWCTCPTEAPSNCPEMCGGSDKFHCGTASGGC